MAIVQTSGLITHIRGSIGGTTFQRSGAGLVARNKPAPVGQGSNFQQVQRNIISQLNVLWEQLTDAQRVNWSSFATYINGAGITNRRNSSSQTGKTQFIAVNSWLLLYGKNYLPSPTYVPALSPIIPFYNADFESDNLGKTVGSLNTSTQILVTQVSLAQSESTYTANTGFRTLVYSQANGTTQDWNAAYLAQFGVSLVVGKKYWVNLKVVDYVTGAISSDAKALIRYVSPFAVGIGEMVVGSTFIVG